MWFPLEIRGLALQCTEERRRIDDEGSPNIRDRNYDAGFGDVPFCETAV